MKLADWSGHNGIDYKTAYRLFKSGRFPRSVEQLPTGTILVTNMKQEAPHFRAGRNELTKS